MKWGVKVLKQQGWRKLEWVWAKEQDRWSREKAVKVGPLPILHVWRNEAELGFPLISVRKCSQEASASSHTTPIISPPCRCLCVSIYRVLFKLWEGSSLWACWHLSSHVCRRWQSLIVWWRSFSRHVWRAGRGGMAYIRTILFCSHPAGGGWGRGMFLLVLFCAL